MSAVQSHVDVKSDAEVFARLAELEALDVNLPRELQAFREQLILDGLPELEEDTKTTKMKHGPCVCLLSWTDEKRAMVEEGGKQAPRRVNLCLTPAWLERRLSRSGTAVDLFMHRGINLDSYGQARLMTFNPPQKVTYFVNLITKAVNTECDDGVDFELGRGRFADSLSGLPVACPRSSSPALEQLTNDKLHTRIVLTHARVSVPETLAYVYRKSHNYPPTEGTTTKMQYWEDLDAVDWTSVEQDIEKFLERMVDKCDRVVVKPSGPLWMGSVGVSFQPLEAKAVLKAVQELSKRIHPGDAVLVDEFCKTLSPQDIFSQRELPLRAVLDPAVIAETSRVQGAVQILKAEAEMNKNRGAPKRFTVERSKHVGQLTKTPLAVLNGFRIRTVVQRTDNGPVIAKHVCAVGPGDEPLHGANTIPQTLEVTLQQWGITGDKAEDVRELIETDARAAFRALAAYEESLTPEELGGPRAQTDCVGLDIILTHRNGAVEAVVIEVNDHDCLFHSMELELMHPNTRGECARPWTATMLQRSQQHMRRDMTLVVVGGGGHSKAFLWPLFKEKGFQVVLLDENPNHFAKDLVDVFIAAPEIAEHSRDLEVAESLVKRLADAGLTPDKISGCVTYWEDCSPLNARLCELLGKPGNTYEAHSIAKSKFMTHKHLGDNVSTKSHCLNAAVPSYKVTSVAELEAAMEKVTVPFMLKTEHGSSSVGVIMVESKQEAIDQYKRLCVELAEEADHPGAGLGFKGGEVAMVVMNYIDGSEHNVDVLMCEGKPLFCAISDYAPTKLPYFSEVASCMPSRLHPHRQDALTYAAVHCLKGLGLMHGAFNVGLKYTTMGPRLFEVNARMGGFYLRDWIQRIYGVDMALCSAMLACGVQPFIQPHEPACTIAGVMMYASVTAGVMRAGGRDTLRKLAEEDEIVLNEFEEEIPDAEEFEEPICNVACEGKDFEDASKSVAKTLRVMRLSAMGGVAAEWYLENI